jgi:hypothetical protein
VSGDMIWPRAEARLRALSSRPLRDWQFIAGTALVVHQDDRRF